MQRILIGVAIAALTTLLPAAPAVAQAPSPFPFYPETYTPEQAFATPTVTVGGKTASRLCELGITDTEPDQPGGVGVAVDQVAVLPCSQQRGVQPLRLNRARYARVTLQAPADRVLAGWYESGALRPLTPVQTGAQQWNVTLPPTSGRLFLRITFEINLGAVPYDLRTDWKLSIRRRAKPAPTEPVPTDPGTVEPVVPIDSTPEQPAPPPR